MRVGRILLPTVLLIFVLLASTLLAGEKTPIVIQAGASVLSIQVSKTTVSESDRQITGTVSRVAGSSTPAVGVVISTSDSTELMTPAMVVTAAGSLSSQFDILIRNDGEIDGPQSVTITAAAAGYESGSVTVEVLDDDSDTHRTIGGRISGVLDGRSYEVIDTLTVEAGEALEIQAGAVLRFDPNCGLTVRGSLAAKGDPNQPIVFTSASEPGAAGDWEGITIEGNENESSDLESVDISLAGTGVQAVWLHAAPKVVFRNSKVHQCSGNGVHVQSRSGQSITAEDVQILGSDIYENGLDGVRLESISFGCDRSEAHARLWDNNIFANGGAGIGLIARNGFAACLLARDHRSVGAEVLRNEVYRNRVGIGLTTQGSMLGMTIDPAIENNIVHDNAAEGLRLVVGAGRLSAKIVNNTVAMNGLAGIAHSSALCPQLQIVNNAVAWNGAGLLAEGPFDPRKQTGASVAYNDVYSNAGGDWIRYPAAYGNRSGRNANGSPADAAMNISVDPCFVQVSYWDQNGTPTDANDDFWVGGDYRLRRASLCIDAGDPNGDYGDRHDVDGMPRRVGLAVDIGADEQECFQPGDPKYTEWVSLGSPDCWCYLRQCHGDTDGKKGGNPGNGSFYVGPTDLTALIGAWLVKEPPKGPGIASVPGGICADFGHDLRGSNKTGFYRVGPSDLNILLTHWLVKEPPFGPGVPADCLSSSN